MNAPSKFAMNLLLVFVGLHLIFSACFALKTPYRQAGYLFSQRDSSTGNFSHPNDIGAPDERQHANYIRHLLKNRTLPILNPKAADLGEEYQAHQPPLFYVTAATVATLTGQTDVETRGFGLAIRFLNCLLGSVAIVGVFLGCFWASKREDIAILATAFAAILPMNCALSGAISNDPLVIAMIAWSFAYCSRALNCDNVTKAKGYLAMAAIFVGFACLSKSSGLVALGGLFATCISLRNTLPLKPILFTAIMAFILVLPVWIRNQILYGDPLAQNVFKEAFKPTTPSIIAGIEASNAPGSAHIQYWINWVGYWTARSFIGVFGYMDIWLNSTGRANSSKDPNLLYKILIGFIALAKVGFLVHLRNKWSEVLKPVLIGLFISILTLLLFVAFNLTYFQAQARYLLPAMAPIALILSIGWLSVFRSKLVPALLTVVVLFGGTTIYSITRLEPEFSARISGIVSPQ